MITKKDASYYSSELIRKLSHYFDKKFNGYTSRGDLDAAARYILSGDGQNGLNAGSQFPGKWPRDLCFSARGLRALDKKQELDRIGREFMRRIDDTFYTDFQEDYSVAAPKEGVDTFPAVVIILDEADTLSEHGSEIAVLADMHREKFFDDDFRLVTGNGSSWWDSAKHPRQTYNTHMLLAALDRLERRDIETTYMDMRDEIKRSVIEHLWNGDFFDEYIGSSVLSCDANVVPLYFDLVDDRKAQRISDSLEVLQTEYGLLMREKPFELREVHPFFYLHRDYHFNIWPWNSMMYAVGLYHYGFHEKARVTVKILEDKLGRHGNFLEVLNSRGEPYVKNGFASAEDFTVAAALWVEFRDLVEDGDDD